MKWQIWEKSQTVRKCYCLVQRHVVSPEKGVIYMKHVDRKAVAFTSVSILAGLLILLSFQIDALPLPTPVDVAVTSITDVDGMIIYFSGVNKTVGTNLTIDVTVERAPDASGITTLLVNVTLNRMNVATAENVTVASNVVILLNGGSVHLSLPWNETLETLPPGSYDIFGLATIISDGDIYDTDLTNNIRFAGRVYVVSRKEDLNGDGKVDIADLAHVAEVYGMQGLPGWIPEDLMPDGVIDDFDVNMVLRMSGWTFPPGPSAPPYAVSWILKFATTMGNFTVDVFSDYIVYSTYEFNKTLRRLNFNVTSSVDAFCNASIPNGLMSGAFQLYLDDVLTPSIVTWNATHHFVYFRSAELSHRVSIVCEVALPIVGDLNHDGKVDIFDAILLANNFGKENDC
jgi:hypothetical protein